MIDVKRTTLVPSLRALTAFKARGQLDPLMLEYIAERAAVAAAIDRPVSDVIVDLSQGAIAATEQDLNQASGAPPIRKRLLNAHAIHPDPMSAATYRTLADHAVGLDRHAASMWLWFASELMRDDLTKFLTQRALAFGTPTELDWPVTDTLAVNAAPSKALLRALKDAFVVVDVDHNGRPFPTTTP